MKSLKWMVAAVLLGLAAHTAPVQAALLAYEGFDYTSGSAIAGQNGGTGSWTAAWSSSAGGSGAIVTSPGSNYTGLSVTGNKADFAGPSAANVFRRRTLTLPGVTSGTIYFSALFDTTNANTGFFGLEILNGTAQQAYIGKNSSQTNWRMSRDGSGGGGSLALDSGVSATSADPTLLVLRVDFNYFSPGVNNYERLSLYVNSTAGAPEPLVAQIISSEANAFQFTGMTQIGLAATSTMTGTFDEIRIGTAWSDVVPEPAGLAALSVGALALMRRARLQHAKGCE